VALLLLLSLGTALWLLLPVLIDGIDGSQPQQPSAKSAVVIEEALFRGDVATQKLFADVVSRDLRQGLKPAQFQTGNRRFDGEWTLRTYHLAVLGLGQVILQHPELRSTYLPRMEQAAAQLLTAEASTDADAYVNLALSMLRLLEPNHRFAEINDRLTQVLIDAKAVDPIDQAAGLAAIALHDRVTQSDRRQRLTQLTQQFQQRFVDAQTGLVIPAGEQQPRASSTALSAYYLSFVDPNLSRQLLQSVVKQKTDVFGFMGIREYPLGQEGAADLESGPLVFGASPAATGFAIALARIVQDRQLYLSLSRTFNFFSTTMPKEQKVGMLANSPLKNAIALSMLTAQKLPPQDR
jgi:hypothetical protein